MLLVPAIHVRNVPAEVVETLRARATRHGRSLNAEIVEVLAESAAEEQRSTALVQRMEELAREIDLPPDAPRPEELIRSARDAR